MVPNCNAIMLSMAYGVAVARNAVLVATAVHAGDHYVYPDCHPEFIEAFDKMQRVAVEEFGDEALHLYTLFINKTKAEIVEAGAKLKVPYIDTWSCYEDGELHCGLCRTCTERKESFELVGITEPTEYRALEFRG